MTTQRIKQFANDFSNHLFDESLLITHQDKLDVESKLQIWLNREFAVEPKPKTKARKGTV
jgi:dsRNA-specific ribonuclease